MWQTPEYLLRESWASAMRGTREECGGGSEHVDEDLSGLQILLLTHRVVLEDVEVSSMLVEDWFLGGSAAARGRRGRAREATY